MSSIFDSASTELTTQANDIIKAPNMIVNTMYSGWAQAFDLLHGNPNKRPQLLEIIGTYGTDLFLLNNTLTTFMVSELTGRRDDIVDDITKKLSTLPNFIFNNNGTVSEVLVTVPSTSAIFYNQPLSSTVFIGGSAMIPGSFALVSPSVVPPSLGSYNTEIYFVPTNNVNFKTTTHSISISVVPAVMTDVTFVVPENLVYDMSYKTFDAIVVGPKAIKKSYSGRNTTTYTGEVPPINAGDYTFIVMSDDTNYTGTSTYNYTISTAEFPPVIFTPPILQYNGVAKTIMTEVSGADHLTPILAYVGRNSTFYPETNDAPIEVGDYTVTAYPPNNNYTGSYTYDFTITPAPSS
jgi:hypothetical protein